MELNKSELIKLLEPHFERYLIQDKYEIYELESNSLLSYTRFDLAFKILYVEMMNKDVSFAKEVYKEHIRALSSGKFTEPGNNEKNSIKKFISEFETTFESIKNSGFDFNESIIPLSKNGCIANGAHRIASAIYLNKNVKCVNVDSVNHIYNYKFFYSREVPREILDIASTKFVEYADNIYIAFVWPTAQGHDKELEETIPNIVYRKDVELTLNGAHNLLSQIYSGEKWLGNIQNNFSGSKGKLLECFKSFKPVRVIAFQADSLDEVLKIKSHVREIFNVGKHSIHITDTKEEAITASRMMFNDNSIHFLNYAMPNNYISLHNKMDKLKEYILDNNIDSERIVLSDDSVLSAYGLKESKSLDWLIDENKKCDVIYNPAMFFYFNGLKFVSISKLVSMKKERLQGNDLTDIKVLSSLLVNSASCSFSYRVKQKVSYYKMRSREKIVSLLKVTGLFKIVRSLLKMN
jgi:hypothetical protein